MSRILEIAIKNHKENRLSEDFQPDQIFKRRAPENVLVSNFSEMPIEPHREEWEVVSTSSKTYMTRQYKFLQPKHLLYFINESIRKSEEMNHHPKLIVEKDTVTVETFTHDIADVTSQDKDLAEYMDEVFQDIVYISEL